MIVCDYICTSPDCGDVQEHTVPSPAPDIVECETCGEEAHWLPSPIRGSVRVGEVERGKVAKPDSPMFCDTRELGEGMPLSEWKAKRAKMYEERRFQERKRGDG